MSLSPRTRAAFIRAVATRSHAEISTLAVKLDVPAAGYTRNDRAAALIASIFHDLEPEEGSRRLLDVTPRLIRDLTSWEGLVNEVGQQLLEALRLDGYAFHNGTLVPATPEPAALEPQLSVLEHQLQDGGYQEALTHYRQAGDSLVAGNHEAANGQTRSFLESLFRNLCAVRTGKKFADAGAALQHLKNAHWLDDGEWNPDLLT